MLRILTQDVLDPHGFSELDEEQVDRDASGDDANPNAWWKEEVWEAAQVTGEHDSDTQSWNLEIHSEYNG